ncbi:UMP kinase [Candidatus Dependentiae bacterium]|nr:MAG: UMP kinase [Candidatus Dependentiae bacterium]
MKRLLIKISGEFFTGKDCNGQDTLSDQLQKRMKSFVRQLKELQKTYHIGIVIGGGNIVRGKEVEKTLGVRDHVGHQMGMLATVINALCLEDLIEQHGGKAVICSAIEIPHAVDVVRYDRIENAFDKGSVVIFAGGTGQPFLSTDTAAVLYALRMKAEVLWKCTKVDGVYDADPFQNKSAKRHDVLSYQQVLDKKLHIMDLTAITLAEQHALPIRVMNMYHENTLLKALKDNTWGSWIQ